MPIRMSSPLPKKMSKKGSDTYGEEVSDTLRTGKLEKRGPVILAIINIFKDLVEFPYRQGGVGMAGMDHYSNIVKALPQRVPTRIE